MSLGSRSFHLGPERDPGREPDFGSVPHRTGPRFLSPWWLGVNEEAKVGQRFEREFLFPESCPV